MTQQDTKKIIFCVKHARGSRASELHYHNHHNYHTITTISKVPLSAPTRPRTFVFIQRNGKGLICPNGYRRYGQRSIRIRFKRRLFNFSDLQNPCMEI